MMLSNIRRSLVLVSCLAVAPLAPAADAPPDSLRGTRVATYNSWENSLHLLTDNASLRAVVVPGIGGRIIHYSVNGEGILFESPGTEGKTILNTKSNFWAGGYQSDIGPELRPIPAHKELWMGPWQGHAIRPYTVSVTSEPDTRLGVQLEKEILMDGDTGDLGITQKLKNISDKEIAYCLWDRTLCKGGGYALIPLNKKSRFPAKWSQRKTFEDKMYYDGDKPASPKVRVMDGVLVAKAEGEASKIGADCEAGWIAYTRGRLLLIKYFPYFPKGEYTDGGNSVELYWSDQVAELEPLSPETKLAPGGSYIFPEKWVLMEIEDEATSFERARALVKRIPPSPFKR